jgi:hypothetical protein
MPTLVTPTHLQKLEVDVTTAEGPSRMTIVTGLMPVSNAVLSSGTGAQATISFKTLVDPVLTPAKFRKAIATAAFSGLEIAGPSPPLQARWQIVDTQATFDDEESKVQLVVDVLVIATSSGPQSQVLSRSIAFQVTTLAAI